MMSQEIFTFSRCAALKRSSVNLKKLLNKKNFVSRKNKKCENNFYDHQPRRKEKSALK